MADISKTGTADDPNRQSDVTINNNFAGATINNVGNLLQDSASQTANVEQPCSPAPTPEAASPLPTRKSATFVIEGSIKDLTPTELARLQGFVESLRKRTGDASLTVTEFTEGSIRLTLEGSDDGIAKLQELIDAGELSEILERPIKTVDFENVENSTPTDAAEDLLKDFLVDSIRAAMPEGLIAADLRVANLWRANLRGSNLSEADLRVADLSEADLRVANLSKANLWRADLSEADLRRANLWRADLRVADLSKADLRVANLSEANLSGANLSGANVEKAILIGSKGLTELAKADLKFRGAIFEDSPGDRSEVFTPVTPRR